jgi:ubiquinone/menaquinone biosynthesis C-methylase UbiE
MSQQYDVHAGSASESYERHFVPAIGAPLANDLVKIAALQPGERVLDVACGTGVVARLASQAVGSTGSVVGVDVDPGMLAVARSVTPPGLAVDWREANAESMPLRDGAFDAVLCQMGLQFVPDKHSALSEMRRVLAPGGRLLLNVPGPTPQVFDIMKNALAHHIGPEAAGFVNQVFSLHDAARLQNFMNGAGFRNVSVRADLRGFRLPAPREFLWQYVQSTPLAAAVSRVNDERRGSLEREVVSRWQEFIENRALMLRVRVVTATGRK